jgi:hypothetical protein
MYTELVAKRDSIAQNSFEQRKAKCIPIVQNAKLMGW